MENSSEYSAYNPDKARNSFGTASLVMGILSTVLLCTGILAIPFGALGVIFSILSRKNGENLGSSALTGMVLSITGMVIGLALSAIAIYRILYDPSVWDQINELYPDFYKYMNGF